MLTGVCVEWADANELDRKRSTGYAPRADLAFYNSLSCARSILLANGLRPEQVWPSKTSRAALLRLSSSARTGLRAAPSMHADAARANVLLLMAIAFV